MEKYKKKRRPLTKKQKILFDIIIAVCVIAMVFSLYQIISYTIKTKQSKEDTAELINEAVEFIEETTESQAEETSSAAKGSSGPYFAKIPTSINFEKLLSANSEIEGWLFCQNGVINYPVLHTDNNDYYLNHLYNGKKNANGSLFIDAVNKSNFGSQNTVIHGHSMNNGTMFATLLRYKRQGYYDTYPSMYLFTPKQNYRIDFFAGYVTKTDDAWYTTGFWSEEEFESCYNYALQKSAFKSSVTATFEDKFVTLSTCAYDFNDARFLLIGKLVKTD